MTTEKAAPRRRTIVRWAVATLAALAASLPLAAQKPPPRPCHGRVLDAAGKPLAGVAVAVVPFDDAWTSAELIAASAVRTDADGAFAFVLPPNSPDFEILFVKRGYVHTVQRASRLPLFPVQLGRARAVAGRVRTTDGHPVVGARVAATDYLRRLPFLHNDAERNPQEQLRCAVRTDDGGRFVLDGVFGTALVMEVSAIGYRTIELAPVSMLDPIDVTMTAVGVVEGRVLLEDGAPAAGAMLDLYTREGPRRSEKARADAEGRFAISWLEAPSKLEAGTFVDGQHRATQIVIDAPGSYEVKILTPAPAAAAPPPRPKTKGEIEVTATLADGTPVPEFRVAAWRFNPSQQRYRSDHAQLEEFAEVAVVGRNGAAMVPVQIARNEDRILLLAVAEGCATARIEAAGDAKKAVIRFEPEAVVQGKVIDRATKQPIVGAFVWFEVTLDVRRVGRAVQPLDESFFRVTTGVDGGFRLPGPVRGDGRICVCAAGYAEFHQPCKVTTGLAPLELAMNALVDVELALPPPASPLVLGVRPRTTDPLQDQDDDALSGLVPFAADGSLRCRELPQVPHWFELVVASAPRQGHPMKRAVSQQDVRAGMARIALEEDAAATGRVRGRVTGSMPLQRLAVLSSPPFESGSVGYAYLHYRGQLCPLDIDGSFDLRELPGPRVLLVIDIVTGVVFARGELAEVDGGGEHTQDFEIAGAPVRITVQRGQADGQSGDMFVELLPPQALWPGGVGQIVAHDGFVQDYCLGMGVVVPSDADHVDLWLPPVTYDLALRAYQPTSSARASEPHGPVVTLEVKPDADNAVTVGW